MHRSLTSALAACLSLIVASAPNPPSARAATPTASKASAAGEARGRLSRGDARGAVDVLESALPGATAGDRPALLDALNAAYPAAAALAEREGKTAEADSYRDNLQILNRGKPRPAPAPTPTPPPAPTTPKAEPEARPEPEPKPEPEPRAKRDPETRPVALAPADPAAILPPLPAVAALDSPPALAAPDSPPAVMSAPEIAARPAPALSADPKPPARLVSIPAPAPSPPVASDRAGLHAAVEAFKAEDYDKAGRLFAAADRLGKLPAGLRSHWAYCRAVEVVRRLNARPASAEEWAAIDAEIQNIRALSPSNWFAEYLRNLASERNRDGHARPTRSNKVVVRGSSPDEPAPGPGPGPALAAANPASPVAWSRQPLESANFVVVHVEKDRALAEEAARIAEAARESQIKRWGGASEAWSPRCEIVLFPTAAEFARETLQPADSPGFSTMGMNAGKIVLRRVHLRTDHPNMLKAILPHEVAHVVLADLFPSQQIPRWADEGMAVLAEPHSEQTIRAADLDEPLRSGRVFRVGDLMTMEAYPRPEYWGLYYAQSVSLTRFLVETGSPAQFVRFVQQSQQTGVESALKQVYSISGFGDLQRRWLAYARETSPAKTAVAASAGGGQTNPGAPRP